MGSPNEQACDECGGQVLDYDKHRSWHDQLTAKLRDHDKVVQEIKNIRLR